MSAVPTLPELSEFAWLSLDEIRNPIVRTGRDYWQSIKGQRAFPARHDLKARALAKVLPYMTLLRVIDDGADFEHRIVGDTHVRAFNVPLLNRRFSEMESDVPILISTMRPIFQKVVHTGVPVAFRGRVGRKASYVAFTDVESTFLPLGDSDQSVDHVVVFSVYWRSSLAAEVLAEGDPPTSFTPL